MAQSIEYQKLMTEMVHINLPGPQEPEPGMSGGELLHGFLADLHLAGNRAVKDYLDAACTKWNVHYRTVRSRAGRCSSWLHMGCLEVDTCVSLKNWGLVRKRNACSARKHAGQ